MGFQWVPRKGADSEREGKGKRASDPNDGQSTPTGKATPVVDFQPNATEFWRAETFRIRGQRQVANTSEDTVRMAAVTAEHSVTNTTCREIFEPLAPLVDLLNRLRTLVEMERPGSEPDVDRIVDEISRGRISCHVPRRPKRSLGTMLHVVQDLSRRLIPYATDQGILSLELKDRLPKTSLTLSSVRDDDLTPFIHWPDERCGPLIDLASESTVLVMGDLGLLDQKRRKRLVAAWQQIGEQFARRHVQCVAIVPLSESAVPEELSRVWNILPWDRHQTGTGQAPDRHRTGTGQAPDRHRTAARLPESTSLEEMSDQLLSLLSFAVSVEPRLLRRLRMAVPGFRSFPDLESLVWQHRVLRGAGLGGITLRQECRGFLEKLWQGQSDAMRRDAVEFTAAEHAKSLREPETPGRPKRPVARNARSNS
jgi:hypothetical protein